MTCVKMIKKTIIVKIGGKIFENTTDLSATIMQLQSIIDEGVIQNVVIIPGGGSRANFIRKLDKEFRLGNDLSHWMAIYAIDLNGIDLHEKLPFTKLFDNLKKIKEAVNNIKGTLISIFLPYNYLKDNDPLPHSWDVTSDSITLFFAKKLRLNECFFIKNVDGIMIKHGKSSKLIKHISTEEYETLLHAQVLHIKKDNNNELKNSMPIDSFSLTLIKRYELPCTILNGSRSNSRIQSYFKEKKEDDKYYSRIF